jgi:hypothetical protein
VPCSGFHVTASYRSTQFRDSLVRLKKWGLDKNSTLSMNEEMRAAQDWALTTLLNDPQVLGKLLRLFGMRWDTILTCSAISSSD